jgi:hypothetical protein
MKNIRYIRNLLEQEKVICNSLFLSDFIYSDGVEERPNCREVNLVSFAIEQCKSRLFSTRTVGKKTYGLEESLYNLKNLPPSEYIEFFHLFNSNYIGIIYVFNESIVGYAFVEKGTCTIKI